MVFKVKNWKQSSSVQHTCYWFAAGPLRILQKLQLCKSLNHLIIRLSTPHIVGRSSLWHLFYKNELCETFHFKSIYVNGVDLLPSTRPWCRTLPFLLFPQRTYSSSSPPSWAPRWQGLTPSLCRVLWRSASSAWSRGVVEASSSLCLLLWWVMICQQRPDMRRGDVRGCWIAAWSKTSFSWHTYFCFEKT